MNWSKTNKKLCIFIPCYKREEYLQYSLRSIYNNTKWSNDQFEIVVGCDGTDYPINTNDYDNVSSFALNNGSPRNGCFIRNFFIKRCQSDMIFQMDPEIVLQRVENTSQPTDVLDIFTMHCGPKSISRIGVVAATTWQDFERFKETGELKHEVCKNLEIGTPYHFHHGCCIWTKDLQDIGSYEEHLFPNYGMEDLSLRERLLNYGSQEYFVRNFAAIHLWHPFEENAFPKVFQSQQNYIKDRQTNPNKIYNNNSWGHG